jgi:hypothetical protein
VGGSAGTIRIDVSAEGAVSLSCGLVNPRLMFTSSALFDGNLGGLAGADAKCVSLATAANLANASGFRAWISATSVNAIDRFVADARPIAAVSLAKIANSLEDLRLGSLVRAPNQDEHGNVILEVLAWTGTAIGGVYFGQACGDWTNATDRTMAGNPFATTSQWSTASVQPCAAAQHLYCIGP